MVINSASLNRIVEVNFTLISHFKRKWNSEDSSGAYNELRVLHLDVDHGGEKKQTLTDPHT